MALTADRGYATSGRTQVVHAKATASDTYYKGAILQLDKTTGLAKVPADVAGEFGFGVNKFQVVAAAGVNPDLEIERGKVWVPHTGAAQTDVGKFFYASADDTITDTALTNGGPCGYCVDFKTGYLLIDFEMGGPADET